MELFLSDLALFAQRVLLGVFFLLARFRYVYAPEYAEPWFNPNRHASLAHKLEYCGLKNAGVWAPIVAIAELAGALGCIVGLLTPLAALGLLVILVRATLCTGKEKTMRQNPIDKIDVVSCYLWTPEPVYTVMALSVMLLGAGRWSLDGAILAWLG